MIKTIKPFTFDEVLNQLRNLKFDVTEVKAVANTGGATHIQVAKYGAAAVIARAADGKGTILITKPGILFAGEISHLLDRGFQKFFKTSKVEIPATADHLKAEHRFAEELDRVTGQISLYNESLGSVSDEYMYDRVKGRDKDGPAKGLAPWELATGASGGH